MTDARKKDSLHGSTVKALPSPPSEIRVSADAAGAANLMRELIALRIPAALGEEFGHWFVLIASADEPACQPRRVVDVLASAVARGVAAYATVSFGERTFIFEQTRPSGASIRSGQAGVSSSQAIAPAV